MGSLSTAASLACDRLAHYRLGPCGNAGYVSPSPVLSGRVGTGQPMTLSLRPSAYAEGFAAFDVGELCPYVYQTFEYQEWWRGWQDAAQSYLTSEFERAAQ